MKLTASTIALGTLLPSPLNARPSNHTAEDVFELIASIRARGLINPITIHALKKPKGKFGVLAGARRWRALLELASDPAIDAAAIPVMIADGTEAELRELSIAENEDREEMSEVQTLRAFLAVRKTDPKITDEELALRFGCEPTDIRRIMRLANLHGEILKQFEDGKITGDMARAFAASNDQAEQLRCYKHVSNLDNWEQTTRTVRQFYGFGTTYTVDNKLAFVGRDAFVAAGGKIEQDLFSESIRIIGADDLEKLFVAKTRAAVLAYTDTNPRVRLVDADDLPRGRYGSADYELAITDAGSMLPEDATAYAEAEATRDRLLDELNDHVDEDAMSEEHAWPDCAAGFEGLPFLDDGYDREAALSQLLQAEATIVAIDAKPLVIPDADLLGVWDISKGQFKVSLHWPSREAAGLEPFDVTYPSTKAAVNAQAEAEYGPKATAKAEAVMRSMRVNMMTAYMLDHSIDPEGNNARRAHRALVFDLARDCLSRRDIATGMESYGSCYYGQDLGPISAPLSMSMADWAMLPRVPAWAAFEQLADDQVDQIAAYVWSRRITGAHYHAKKVIVADDMGTVLAVPTMARRYLELDEKFFAMFNKAQIMGFIEEACAAPSKVTGKPMEMSATLKTKLGKYKMKSLQEVAVKLFAGDSTTLKLVGATPHREGFIEWVPSWLRWHDQAVVSDAKYPKPVVAREDQDPNGYMDETMPLTSDDDDDDLDRQTEDQMDTETAE